MSLQQLLTLAKLARSAASAYPDRNHLYGRFLLWRAILQSEENGTKSGSPWLGPGHERRPVYNNFESTDDGRAMGETLLGEGADVIMPVAGPVGLGTAEAIKTAGNAWLIGVDYDWTISAATYKDIILTSVLKNMDVAVFDAAKAVAEGTFKGGTYVGTLANNGIGLATPSSAAPADAVKELDQIKKDLISGAIKIGQ
jgi:basic membrane protein A